MYAILENALLVRIDPVLSVIVIACLLYLAGNAIIGLLTNKRVD